MKRSRKASWSVGLTVLMFEMLSETASIHLRWASRPDPEMLRVSKTPMSLRPECGAQEAVLAVERVEGELVAQAGLRRGDRLLVQVDVVAVGVRRLEGARDRATADRRGLAVVDRVLQRGLEVDLARQEARRVDVGDVVGRDALALCQAGERRVQCRRGGVGDHGTGCRRVQQDTIDL